MFRTYYFAGMTSRVAVIRKNNARFISFLKMKHAFKDFFGMRSDKLPYEHICQIGDPVLRGRAIPVEPEVIKLADFRKVVERMINVMRSYEACGLSGPQIGLPWQMFAIEVTEKHMKLDNAVKKAREMQVVPLQIFINPQLRITDHTSIVFHEGCESVRGFSAVVPRAYEIEITALNLRAEQFTWKARGWPARIAQHEYDHLQGKLFVDRMDVSTFYCSAWEKINDNNGNVRLEYWSRKYILFIISCASF